MDQLATFGYALEELDDAHRPHIVGAHRVDERRDGWDRA